MKLQSVLGLLTIVLLCLSCENESIRAPGEVTSREFLFAGYEALEVGGAFEVFVQFSEMEESVRIEANENLQDKLVVRVDGNTLVIRPQNNLSIKGNATLRAFITTNNLSEIDLTGATTLTLEDDWTVTNGRIQLSGASNLSGGIVASLLDISESGASDVDLFGSVGTLRASLSGSSDLKDLDLLVERPDIELSGSSDAFLSVSESIEIDASGSSSLTYQGNPEIVRQQLSGSSELKRRN